MGAGSKMPLCVVVIFERRLTARGRAILPELTAGGGK